MEDSLYQSLKGAGLEDIGEKVCEGKRISEEDALRLFDCPDLHAVGRLADYACHRKQGAVATYIVNRYLNYSNICILSCRFCAFYRREGEEGAFTFSIEKLVEEAEHSYRQGIREIHCVGGLHPKLPFDYYLALVREIKKACPGIQLKAFTAIEIRHLACRIARLPIEQTLQQLKDAGLDALTGGGAEIFHPEIRNQICRGKETAEEWLEVHRIWHKLGQRSTATMLYGHIEQVSHRVDHLRRLRELQDETGGFTAFVPLPYQPDGSGRLPVVRKTSLLDQLRTIAVSRLYLDNFDHITAYWLSMGLAGAQVALAFGADDLHGTLQEERIYHMAGATTPQGTTARKLERLIREAGRIPVQRDTFYRVVPAGERKELERSSQQDSNGRKEKKMGRLSNPKAS
ncbi:aminofutalosine synthase MqnE [Candidatus Methylacidithermus pantelleriae]|uniref:Aminodeoxyfutalosine synthase n=1 Tax=Candidatus Methylacidithermus pantelleriae TaxID=2744239 RepID=A0A8J2FRS6_9BACT|nr:aminofutalosine synthase MqnE [Candidatus Methylacidithermus pantelleriae]CAF0693621.1 Aminodeoxyfutalosine synthase [Candidatus Methylacidithermus pantelleriae]